MSIYFIRHAQSKFNAAYQPGDPDPLIFDAPLSPLGEVQAIGTRKHIKDLDINKLIVSPLTRTLQTATLIFKNAYPVAINATIREQLSFSGDVGRAPHELTRDYPHLDFDHLEEHWWHEGKNNQHGYAVEPHSSLQQRADQFAAFLTASNTRSTAIVTHGNFIHTITGIQPENCEIIKFDPINRTSQSVTHG